MILGPEITGWKPSVNEMGAFRLNWAHPLNRSLSQLFMLNERAGIPRGLVVPVLGSLAGSAAWTSEDGIDFPGTTSDYVQIPNHAGIQFNGASFTVVIRCRTDTISIANRTLVSKDNLNTGADFPWRIYNYSTSLYGEVRDTGSVGRGMNAVCFTAGVMITVGMTFNPAGNMTLYADGSVIGSPTAMSGYTFDSSSGTGVMRFGLLSYAASSPLDGYIQRVEFWKRELTALEMMEIHLNPYGTPDNPRFLNEMITKRWFVPAAAGAALTFTATDDMAGSVGDAIVGFYTMKASFTDDLNA